MSTALVWLRNDLRLADNPALADAVGNSDSVVLVYIWSPGEHGIWSPGPASRAWLARSLSALGRDIEARGGRLLILRGQTGQTLLELAQRVGATCVYWNRRYEPHLAQRDERVRQHLASAGVKVLEFAEALLHDPETLVTSTGGPYRVFTPFLRANERGPQPPLPIRAPERIPCSASLPASEDAQVVLGEGKGVLEIAARWTPGEAGANDRANHFFDELADLYADDRNRPDLYGTSRLSPHVAFGEISSRTLWHRANEIIRSDGTCDLSVGAAAFARQLYWRDFAYHLLLHFPQTSERPLRERFEVFPWSKDPVAFEAWQTGMTGYPMIDAGMREMLATGWMHNRVRMLVASFLTKDLLLPWLDGARWFWERLADADLANNTLGWQWVAGCGADAAPYFRVFNPVSQGQKFDPDGAYVRSWVPELAALPTTWIHRPWAAPEAVLSAAGIVLGRDYPVAIVDHAEARARALAIYGSIRDVVG